VLIFFVIAPNLRPIFKYSNFFQSGLIIIDLIIVSLSYVIRVLAGSIIINVVLSEWLLICVFSSSLFLISFKRLAEMKISDFKSRPILKKYNNEILLKIIDVSAICSIIFYSLYTVFVNPNLIYTVPLIFVGFFRYYYLYYTAKIFEESPVKIIFSDKPILALLILWLVIVLVSIRI
jgi:decaprenyl-phosphate phosphoribosyltransferase